MPLGRKHAEEIERPEECRRNMDTGSETRMVMVTFPSKYARGGSHNARVIS